MDCIFRFLRFIAALNPTYQVPTRSKISKNLVPEVADRIEVIAKRKLKDVAHISITTDSWTSDSADSYEALTAHYIDDKDFKFKSITLGIGKLTDQTAVGHVSLIQSVLSSYDGGLQDKVRAMVSDNAAVMKSTAALLSKNFIELFKNKFTGINKTYVHVILFHIHNNNIY